MKNILVVIGMVLVQSLWGQNQNQFTFRDFDGQLVGIWLAAYRGDLDQIKVKMSEVSDQWLELRLQINESDLIHFAAPPFVVQQDMLMREMTNAVREKKYIYFETMCYEFLAGFREVRTYFTNDLYPLDELFRSYDRYQELHYAVDDPMLGLYEWKEFIGLFEDFQQQFDHYHVVAEPGFDGEHSVLFKLMTQRVIDCSLEFRLALKTAMQDNFVAPCDDTQDALIDLIDLYVEANQSLQ